MTVSRLVAFALLAVGCFAVKAEVVFVGLAEGFSSRDAGSGIEAAYRVWTAPDTEEACSVSHPEQLVVEPVPVQMKVGKVFEYARISVRALDANDRLIPRVPIFISVEKVDPPLLDMGNAEAVSRYGVGVLPIRPGNFRLRIGTACGEITGLAAIVVTVPVEISPADG
jgi:hypothetical protein